VGYALGHGALAAALFLGFWGAGRGLARLSRAPIAESRLPLLSTLGLGLCGSSALLFALAALGALRPEWLRTGALAAAAAGAALALRAALPRAPSALRRVREATQAVEGVALGCLGATLLVHFLLALGPQVAWDAETYHLTLPRIFLEQTGFARVPFLLFSTWPLATELLYAVALAVRDHVLAHLLHFGIGVLLVAGTAALARRQAGPAAGVLAAVLLLLDPHVAFELESAYVDLALALYFLLAFAAWEPSLARPEPQRRRALLALAGVFLGAAAGTKVIGGLGALVFGSLELALGVASRRPPRRLLGDLAYLLAPAALLAAPWYLRSYALMGDPLHPLLYPIFRGGGEEWSPELHARISAHREAYGMGRSLGDLFMLPLRLTAMGDPEAALRFGGTLHPIWALLVPLVAWGLVTERAVRLLVLPALLYALFWALGWQTVRLLLPAQPFLACAAGISIARAARALPVGRRALPALAATAAAALAAISLWQAAPRLAELFTLFARGEAAVLDSAVPPQCRFVNEHLPHDARILMLNTNRTFFCRREFLSDSLFQASQLGALLRTTSDAAGLARLLRERGVSHLLVARRDWGIEWPPHLRAALAQARWLVPIYRDDEHTLYAVEPSAAGAGGAERGAAEPRQPGLASSRSAASRQSRASQARIRSSLSSLAWTIARRSDSTTLTFGRKQSR
jgi:hypothetical protein